MADILVGLVAIPCAVLTDLGRPHHNMPLCLMMLSILMVLTQVAAFTEWLMTCNERNVYNSCNWDGFVQGRALNTACNYGFNVSPENCPSHLLELHSESAGGSNWALCGHSPALPVPACHEPQERLAGPAGHLGPGNHHWMCASHRLEKTVTTLWVRGGKMDGWMDSWVDEWMIESWWGNGVFRWMNDKNTGE